MHPREVHKLSQQRWRKWSEWLYEWLKYKKMYAFLHKNVFYAENQSFISKPKKSQEEHKFLRQKIKESEDKVDDLKSDAKRQKIIS